MALDEVKQQRVRFQQCLRCQNAAEQRDKLDFGR